MGFHIGLTLSESNINITENTSDVTAKVTVYANDGYSSAYNYDTTSMTIVVNGESKSVSINGYSIPLGGSLVLGSATFRVKHNDDGSKSVSASATFYASNSYVGNPSTTGSLTLSTIPRASSFSVTGNTLGSTIVVNISRASSNFTHTVRYQFGSIIREYGGQSTSCTFTPPLSDATQIPNSLSGNATISVYTYNSGTHIGTKSNPLTLNINAISCIPNISELKVTKVDNGVPSSWGIYVEGKSKAMIEILGASAQYGASIKSYVITAGSYSGSNALSTGTFGAGTISIKGTVTDSRGITNCKESQIIVYANSKPSLSMKAERCDKDGVVNNNGTYIKVTPSYSFASVNGKNYIANKSFKINGTSYVNTTGSSGGFFVLGNNDISISKSYEVIGSVSDALAQTSELISVVVPSSSVPFNLRDDGAGAAFGKYAEKKNAFESAWDIYMRGKNLIDLFYPIGIVITNSSANFNPNTLYSGTTWIRIKGRVIVGVDEGNGSFSSSGLTGGNVSFNNAHVHSTGSIALTTAQMPTHGLHLYNGSSTSSWLGHGNTGHYLSAGVLPTATGVRGWYLQAGNELYPCGEFAGGSQAHNHGNTGNAGGVQSLLQPYVTKYVWERTA